MICKACIFDLDGTLLNTIDSIAYFGNNALKHFGLREISVQKYKLMVGNGADTLVGRMLLENGCEDEALFEQVLKYYSDTYNEDFLYKTTVYEGILPLLCTLKEMGIKLAVLSNKPHRTTVRVINAMFGKNYFDICYGNREGVPLKPDPASLCAVMQELAVSPQECLYIGDTKTDMLTGKGGGLFTIGVLWGFRGLSELQESGADITISHPDEILSFIIRNKTV